MKNEAPNENFLDSQKEEYAALVQQNARNKKRFIMILALIGIALILLFVIVAIINSSMKDNDEDDREIFFYPPFEGNILEYEPYLDLDRKIYYYDGKMILSVEEDNLLSFDYGVLFLCDFIQILINGDAVAYNGCFENDPKQAEFSPQMVYGTQISYESASVADNGDRLVTYKLEYRIHRNDGTLRQDIGSGQVKAQYVVLRITEKGFISIESLSTTR